MQIHFRKKNGKYSIYHHKTCRFFELHFSLFSRKKKNSQEVENKSEINFQFMYIKILFITDNRRDTKISYIQVKAI